MLMPFKSVPHFTEERSFIRTRTSDAPVGFRSCFSPLDLRTLPYPHFLTLYPTSLSLSLFSDSRLTTETGRSSNHGRSTFNPGREQGVKNIKIEADLENLCSVVMEEAKDFDYEEEKPLSTRRRRSGGVGVAATGGLREIERHTCSRCSKSYIHAWHLKRHTKFECGQEPRVQCPYCTARMKQRGHVYRHIRQCHRGQNVYVIDLN
ncbi:uncharacterized protein LOC143305699 [Osmia lignaria lignaria]|uniref:uncharacterized protein LOC143305699 n=1 Tax=Osmia lignaria lignaria TaxID=1437193 RepID=UPI00402BBC4E